MEEKMKHLKITGNGLTPMCRLCLSRNVTMGDIFCFSSELGKVIADCIMECAPVQITRHDKMPTCICQLCFTQLKKFHQFQMQAVRSDRTLQRYLQQLSVCHPQIEIELVLEEQSNNSESQNCNVDATTKSDPLEINDEFDHFSSKQKELANFSLVNGFNAEITLKSEIKDEPMDDNSLSPTDCVDTATTLSMHDGSEIRCEVSTIELCDTKVGYFECPIKIENDTTEKIFQRKEETYIKLKDDSSLCSETGKDVEGLNFKEDNMKRTEYPSTRQNFNEKFDDVCNILKKSVTSTVGIPYQCEICKMGFTQRSSLKSHELIHTGAKLYRCEICEKCFKYSMSLKSHKLKHTGEKPYRCEVCEMCFRHITSLKRHKLKHTGEKPHKCDICEKCFRHSQHLKYHMLTHTREKPYQCDLCQMCFRHSNSLKFHKLKHTGEKPYQCDICQKCFRQSTNLNLHKLTHTGEKPYRCEICEMCFKYSMSLKSHKLKHTGEKPYRCEVCELCFRHVNSLKRHKLKHTAEKPHHCEKNEPFEISDKFDNFSLKQKELANFSSENVFNAEITLKSEIKDEPMDDHSLGPTDCVDTAKTLSMYDVSEIRCEVSTIELGDTKVGYFECPIKIENDTAEKISQRKEETFIPLKEGNSSLCSENVKRVEDFRSKEENVNRTEHPSKLQNFNKKFDDVCNILKESATSTVGIPYQCEICNMCFTQRSYLKSHELTHTGEKLYQCDSCQMCFTDRSFLKNHKLIHTGEKPYRCEICEMCFKQKISLKKHNLIHTGEKPYRCEVCGMCFRHLNSLKGHKLKHTGEKPYQCDICEMCFRHSHHLKNHMLTHTGEKPYRCEICEMCFKQRVSLKKHKLLHTGEKPYRCEICGMSFVYLNSFKRHKLQHTGEKPYQCDICQKYFRYSHHLKYHMLSHTGEKPYQCDICQKCFRQSSYLKTHKLKHTGERLHPWKFEK